MKVVGISNELHGCPGMIVARPGVDVAENLWALDATDHRRADRLAFVRRHVRAAAESSGDVERAREAGRRVERDE